MPSPSVFLLLEKSQLFARLSGAVPDGITVVTPNLRLAQALGREFDAGQAARGTSAWHSADILSFDAFVVRLHEDALYSALAPGMPQLLNGAQELTLWEEAVRGSHFGDTLLSPAPAASQCRAAWKLAHVWRLADRLEAAAESEDARAFVDWSARYERATRRNGQIDAARLPDVMAPLLREASLRKPLTLVLYGFDILTPQQKDFCAALQRQGSELATCAMPARPARAVAARLAFDSARDEWLAAAQWARARLEAHAAGEGAAQGGAPRIGVVVPELARARAAVQRAFASVLAPSRALPGQARQALPFNISLGLPLDSFPMVGDALLGIALGGRELPFGDVSRLLRSPFIAAAETEMSARSRLDAALRERAAPLLTLDRLQRLIAGSGMPACPALVARLSKLAEYRRRMLFGMKTASDWAHAFAEVLALLGFPGERALDSVEHQTQAKWHETIAGFASLDRVCGRMSHAEALSRLHRIAAETLFQPEASEVPVHVMGVLESAGMEFDHLWVSGMTASAWPIAARPNAFIPVRLQRSAGIPQSDSVLSLELDARITAGWLDGAGEAVFSHAQHEEDREFSPSPLIAHLPAAAWQDLGVPAYARLRERIHQAAAQERVADAAPALAAHGAIQSGGTAVFRDQAACPFRAFALHRLGAASPQTPQAGLAAMDRGTLPHELLAAAWGELGDSAALAAMDDAALEQLLARCADLALAKLRRRRPDALEERFAGLERARLISLARAWMRHERQRPGFEVVARERKSPVTIGAVTVNARLDRMDRLAAGGHVVIDYKTGQANIAGWLAERPDEPQLPLYAVTSPEDIAAVAFAQIKAGELGFKGISRDPGLLPEVKPITEYTRLALAREYGSWDELLQGWRYELRSLAEGFASGDARVDPKRADTCKHCELHGLCRISERRGGLGGEDEDE